MKSPRQQRNEARRARHRATWAQQEADAAADQVKRGGEARDAARLSRFEVQGRGFRPIFSRTPLAAPIATQTFQSTALGGGHVDDTKASMLGNEKKTSGRQLGGGRE